MQVASQNEIAQWYLQYIEKDGVIYPNYYNEMQDMDIVFFETEQSPNSYTYTITSSCNNLDGSFTADIELPTVSNTIYINNDYNITLQDCESTPRAIYENLFLDVFLNNNAGFPVELSYEITPIENGDTNASPPPPPKLTLTNSSGDSLVYYLTLPLNGILVQNWYLSRIEIPGNDPILIPASDSPSLNITNEINNLTFNTTAEGTGDCNVFQSDYEITLGNGNSIQILGFDATLGLCESSIYEEEYFSILSNITTNYSEFEIINNGQTLILTDLLGARLVFNDDLLSTQSSNLLTNVIKLKSNPVVSELQLQVSDELMNDSRYSIFDIQGKYLQSQTLESETIDVNYLTSGLYFIQVVSEKHQTQTLRFIKQ